MPTNTAANVAPTDAGTGVHVYILDTGIRTTHKEFKMDLGISFGSGSGSGSAGILGPSRAFAGFDAFGEGASGQDCNGHGTHVAAIIGGAPPVGRWHHMHIQALHVFL